MENTRLNFNYFHFLALIYLLSNGGKDNYLEITSSQLSKILNRSQQTASKVLIDLEKENLIERVKNNKRFGMKLSKSGFEILQDIYNILKSSMEYSQQQRISFKGKIVTGMGEGAYYMSLEGYKKQFLGANQWAHRLHIPGVRQGVPDYSLLVAHDHGAAHSEVFQV